MYYIMYGAATVTASRKVFFCSPMGKKIGKQIKDLFDAALFEASIADEILQKKIRHFNRQKVLSGRKLSSIIEYNMEMKPARNKREWHHRSKELRLRAVA